MFPFLCSGVSTSTITISDNTGATYSGTSDANTWEFNPNTNYGTASTFTIGHWDGTTDTRRGYIAFAGLSSVPAGTVSDARIRLYVTANNNTQTYDIHRLTAAFVESQITWNDRSTGNAWTVAGGDYDASVLTTLTVNNSHVGTYIEISGAALTALVQDWLDGVVSNFGLIIKSAVETGSPNAAATFGAREGTDGQRMEMVFDLTT